MRLIPERLESHALRTALPRRGNLRGLGDGDYSLLEGRSVSGTRLGRSIPPIHPFAWILVSKNPCQPAVESIVRDPGTLVHFGRLVRF